MNSLVRYAVVDRSMVIEQLRQPSINRPVLRY